MAASAEHEPSPVPLGVSSTPNRAKADVEAAMLRVDTFPRDLDFGLGMHTARANNPC
jgi:hypothetical protein